MSSFVGHVMCLAIRASIKLFVNPAAEIAIEMHHLRRDRHLSRQQLGRWYLEAGDKHVVTVACGGEALQLD